MLNSKIVTSMMLLYKPTLVVLPDNDAPPQRAVCARYIGLDNYAGIILRIIGMLSDAENNREVCFGSV